MARIVCFILSISYFCVMASGQIDNEDRTHFYYMRGRSIAGATAQRPKHTLAGGDVGIERVFSSGLGVAGEINLTHDETLALTLNASYHAIRASKSGRFVPFISGGYSRVHVGGINGGGGMQLWLTNWLGIRTEYRVRKFFFDHQGTSIYRSQSNIYNGWRVGITFRSPQ